MDRFAREHPELTCNPVVLMSKAAEIMGSAIHIEDKTLCYENCVNAFTPLEKVMRHPHHQDVRSQFYIELPSIRYAEDPGGLSPSKEAYVAAYWFWQHQAIRQGPGHWVGGESETPMANTPFFGILAAYLILKKCDFYLPLAKIISLEELCTVIGLYESHPETLGLAGEHGELFAERAKKLWQELHEVRKEYKDKDAMDVQDQKPAATEPDLTAKLLATPQESGITNAFEGLKT
ncbi:unnamed protein product [Ectocarpus sp. 8 AP-2014]